MKTPLLYLDGTVAFEDVPEGCEHVALPILPGVGDTVKERIFKRRAFTFRGDNPWYPRVVFVEDDNTPTLQAYINRLLEAQ